MIEYIPVLLVQIQVNLNIVINVLQTVMAHVKAIRVQDHFVYVVDHLTLCVKYEGKMSLIRGSNAHLLGDDLDGVDIVFRDGKHRSEVSDDK